MKKTFQKVTATFLLFVMATFNSAFTQEAISVPEQNMPLKDSIEISKVKVIIPKNSQMKLAFAQKFNANKAQVGDKVDFVLSENLLSSDGKIALQKGTEFIGVVENQVKAKSFNRNARALVVIKQVKLPSGQTINLSANVDKKKGELKSPAYANLPKIILELGVIAGAAMVAMAAVVAYAVGTVFTGGIAAVALFPVITGTAAGLGVLICTVNKGVNYKASPGKTVTFILQNDLELYLN